MKKMLTTFIILLLLVFIISIFNFKLNNPKNLKDFNAISYYDREKNLIRTQYNKSKVYLEFNSIDDFLKKSLVTLEDKNFYRHSGVDLKRTLKVFFTNFSTNKKQGASTLTQQLARTLFLTNEKTMARKLKEYYYTLQLEKNYSKNEILESYINNIYLGYNIYGFNDASEFYFNKPLKDLNQKEIVYLINLIKNPKLNNPLTSPDTSLKSFNTSLNFLLKEKVISKTTYLNICTMDLSSHNLDYTNKNLNLNNFYIDLIEKSLITDNIISTNNKNKKNIYTNMDMTLYKIIEKHISLINSKSEISVVAFEPNTFNVLSISGSKNHSKSSYNRAYLSKRQLGSTIKPILYYTALKSGFNSTTTFVSEKTNFKISDGIYSPHNYNHSYDNKPISLAYALATSDNIYAVKTLEKIGIFPFKATLNKLGMNFEFYNLTSSLGSNAETLFNITKVYNIFSSLGTYKKPSLIQEIELNKKVIKKYNSAFTKDTQVLNSKICFILNDLLTLTFDEKMNQKNRVTGITIGKQLSQKSSAKSGLTEHDSYFIGYNPLITLGIWTGSEYDEVLSNKDSSISKTLFLNIMNDYLENKIEIEYKTPNSIFEKTVYLTDQYKRKSYFLK